jgi:hypothetical protein
VFDSAGICVFTSFAWTVADVQPQIEAACEGDWSMEKLNAMGERIWNMERQFNNAAGLTAKDDNLPPRLTTEPAKTGPAKGLVNGDKMLPEYYSCAAGPGRGADRRDPGAPGALKGRMAGCRPAISSFLFPAPTPPAASARPDRGFPDETSHPGQWPAGVVAAEALRRAAPRDEIVMVGSENEPSYSRMAIPYLLEGNIDESGTWLRKTPVTSTSSACAS